MCLVPTRVIPAAVRTLPIGERIRWARQQAGLSHDRLIEKIGRSNRSHLIKVEQGKHVPGPDLRRAVAEATDVPADLFDEDDEEADRMPLTGDEFALLGDLMARLGLSLSERSQA